MQDLLKLELFIILFTTSVLIYFPIFSSRSVLTQIVHLWGISVFLKGTLDLHCILTQMH
jgi:hypothetical protein